MVASLVWPTVFPPRTVRRLPPRLVANVMAMARPTDGASAGREKPRALDDRAARRFREQILPHLDAAYTYAHVLTRGNSAAEDIVHDAYIRALKAFAGFRGDNEKAWILAIVRNCFLTWTKSTGRRGMDIPIETCDVEDVTETAEARIAREDDAKLVRRLVGALPPALGEVILLREVEDLSYREIAITIDAPIGTVMSRLARARTALADAWRKETGDAA